MEFITSGTLSKQSPGSDEHLQGSYLSTHTMPPIKLSLNKVTDIKLQHGYNDNEIHIHYSSSLFNTSPDMDITATAQTDRETDESSTCLCTLAPQEEMFGKVKGQFSAVGCIQCPVERLLTLKCIDLKMPLNI